MISHGYYKIYIGWTRPLHVGPSVKATLNKSVRVELVETYQLQINRLQMASTGSARTEGLVQLYLNGESIRLVFSESACFITLSDFGSILHLTNSCKSQ